MSRLESHAAPAGTIVFTLVHGTFACRADWVTPDKSGFRRALAEALPEHHVEFDDTFKWGYETRKYRDNFEKTRSIGAASLEEHVLRPRANGPALANFLVAHSHGGNVALSALKNKEVRRSIGGLVCLATPFLFSRRRQLPARLLGFSVIFVGLLIFQLTRTQLPWVYRSMLFASALAYLALMLAALVDRVSRRRHSGDDIDDIVDRVVATGIVDDRVGGLEEMPEQFPLLIVRPSGDEASGLLRMSQFVTWLLGRMLGALNWVLGVLIGVGVAIAITREAAPNIGRWFGREEAVTAWMESHDLIDTLDPVIGVVLGVGCLIVVLIAAQVLAFRFDRLHEFASVEPMVEDAPPGIKAQVLVLRPYTSLGVRLAHTEVYNKPETIQAIADWVRERVSQTGRAAATA